jgi:hypothetical protein
VVCSWELGYEADWYGYGSHAREGVVKGGGCIYIHIYSSNGRKLSDRAAYYCSRSIILLGFVTCTYIPIVISLIPLKWAEEILHIVLAANVRATTCWWLKWYLDMW